MNMESSISRPRRQTFTVDRSSVSVPANNGFVQNNTFCTNTHRDTNLESTESINESSLIPPYLIQGSSSKEDVFSKLLQFEEASFFAKAPALASPSIFETSETDIESTEVNTRMDSLRKEEKLLLEEKIRLQEKEALMHSLHSAKMAAYDKEIKDAQTKVNALEKKKKKHSGLFTAKKASKQIYKQSIEQTLEKVDLPKLVVQTFLGVSDKVVCTDKSFCQATSGGVCFPASEPRTQNLDGADQE